MGFNPVSFGFNLFQLIQADQLDESELQNLQMQRLQLIFKYAIEKSSFYRHKYHGITGHTVQLKDLPPVSKRELMSNFDDWVTDSEIHFSDVKNFISNPANIAKPYLDKYTVWESSGSTNMPGIFLVSDEAMSIYDALEFSRKSTFLKIHQCLNSLVLSDRVAFVGVNSGHFASIVSFERMRANNPYLQDCFKSFSILATRSSLIQDLNEYSPNILVTYPTAALAMANAKERGDLKFELSEILTGGENLTESAKNYIQNIFQCKVINSYGASEFLPIAWECDKGELHVNADWVILEPVNEKKRPVPDGVMSHTTLLTNLANFTQPLLRYDLGDSVAINRNVCACGCRLPTIHLRGRGDDVLKFKDGKGRYVEILPLAITTVLEQEVGIFDFQITQDGSNSLRINLAMTRHDGRPLMQRCKKALANYLNSQAVSSVEIKEIYDAPFIYGRSGKIKRVLFSL